MQLSMSSQANLVEVSEGRFYNLNYIQAISPPHQISEEDSEYYPGQEAEISAHIWMCNGDHYEMTEEEYEELVSILRSRKYKRTWRQRLLG